MSSLKILIPNSLTACRLVTSGLIFWVIFLDNFKIGSIDNFQVAGLMMIFALLTDLFDGMLARKLKAITRFGYYFDHIVDFFLLVSVIYVAFYRLNYILSIAFIILEIDVVVVSAIRIFIKDNTTQWPNNWGRTSYGFVGVAVCIIMLIGKYSIYFTILANLVFAIGIVLRLISLVIWHKEVIQNA